MKIFRDFKSLAHFIKKYIINEGSKSKNRVQYSDTLEEYRNKHKGERCFIVALGPSLELKDIEKLSGEWTFSVNSAVTLFDKTDWRPNYYGVVDGRPANIVGDYLSSTNKSCYDKMFCGSKVGINFPKMITFPQNDMHNVLNETVWKKFPKLFPETKFSSEISEVVYTGKSVVYAMLQVAAYMGFSEIYLLGVDCNYAQGQMYSSSIKYVDHKNSWSKDKLKKNGNDMLPQYEVARKFADRNGIKIYNATRGGCLEAFERVNFDDLF